MYINCTATFCQHEILLYIIVFLFLFSVARRQKKQNPANTLYFQHTYKSIFYNRKHTTSFYFITLIFQLIFSLSVTRDDGFFPLLKKKV